MEASLLTYRGAIVKLVEDNIMKKKSGIIDNYFFVELNNVEITNVNGGGGLGRIIGWILGMPEGYIRHCQTHPDMSETLMNCI